MGKTIKNLCIGISIALIVVVLAMSSFAIVPTGYTGVRTTFGQVDSKVVQPGFNFKIPFVQSISKVNNKQQDIDFPEDRCGIIGSESSERTVVNISDITVTYTISPEKSAWIFANISDYKNNLVSFGIVSSAIKATSKQLNSTDVTNRNKIEPLTQETLQSSLDNKYGKGVITVNKVIIKSINFDEAYDKAISDKQNAQLAYEKQQIANKQAIEKAEADAEVKKKNAQAEADAKLIEAEAEAKANKKINDSLSDKVINYNKIEKWDGKLPSVVGDNATVIKDFSTSTTEK